MSIIVGVGALIIRANREVLLVLRKNPPAQNLWAIPGGKIDFGEDLKEGLIREIKEETSLNISVKQSVAIFTSFVYKNNTLYKHYVIVDFLAEVIDGETVAGDDALKVKWFDMKNLPENVTLPTKKIIEKYLAKKQMPYYITHIEEI